MRFWKRDWETRGARFLIKTDTNSNTLSLATMDFILSRSLTRLALAGCTPRTMTHKNAQETAHRHLATQQTAANLALPPSAYDAATLWRLVVAPARGTCLWWRERVCGEMDGRE